jgi:hypothetical protein
MLHIATNRCQTSQSLSVLSLRWQYLRTTNMLLSLLTMVDCGLAQQNLGNGTVNLIPNVQVGLNSWSGKCVSVIVSLYSPYLQFIINVQL